MKESRGVRSDAETMRAEKGLTSVTVSVFRKAVYRYYREHGRRLPWRETCDAYEIMVSEIMLQQTQVKRVTPRYREFLTTFPDFATLAQAPLREILKVWQGLGYNRRALQLKQTAATVISKHHGSLPRDLESLVKLPGIGRASASAILTFAFNEPTVFIETNIRAAFIHFFFQDRTGVEDKEIYSLVAATLDRSNPRTWYYALMDYGAMAKKEFRNPGRKSIHYQRQSPFQGSDRQIRGMILRVLLEEPQISLLQLAQTLGIERERLEKSTFALEEEGLIQRKGRNFTIG